MGGTHRADEASHRERTNIMERITRADVQQAFANYVDTLERYGVTYEGRLGIDEGSKAYGRAWRIYRTGWTNSDGTTCTGHAAPPVGNDYLGMTAREAMETLHTITRTMHDMAYALELARRETTRDGVEASIARDVRGGA